MISWKVTKDEHKIICNIAHRASEMAARVGHEYPFKDALMDITAVHANGCPLRLEEFLAADEFNFAHDAFGIYRYIDRETGKLTDCFLPRFYDSKVAV